MRIEQKPVELLQAQVALYAESQNESDTPSRARHLLSGLGDISFLSDRPPELITYQRERDKKGFNDGNIVTLEPAGSPLPLFERKEYADFLKDPLVRKQSRNLASMGKTYSQLATQITSMELHEISYKEAGEHPNILGRGSNKAAFALRAEVDGVEKDLVVLVDHAPDKSHANKKLLERAANLSLVKGMPGFEQGVAWSNDPPVVVSERASGSSLEELSEEQLAAIPDEHWRILKANVLGTADLGIALDPMPGNFFYDPKEGFTVIDFRRCKPGNEKATQDLNIKQIEEIQTKARKHDSVAV